MYFISQVDGEEIDMDDFLTDTFDSWSNKMKGDGEFADHIVVQATARKLRTDILIVTSSPESNPENCIVYIIGENNFSGIPILLGHYWENHYQSLECLSLNCCSKYFSFSIMCRHKIHNTNVTGLVYIIHFEV
jgi:hypothetical protein